MVAMIRYILALKSSRNIHLSNLKVSLISLTIFLLVVIATATFFGFNISQDIPFTLYVEACLVNEREPRNMSALNLIVLRTGAVFNTASVIVDCLMIRFIKRTTLKSAVNPSELSNVIFVVESNAISGKNILQKYCS
jgi:hypothetical protein